MSEQLSVVVRPLLAIMFGATACVAFLIDKLNTDQWMTLAGMVIGLYFAGKTAEVALKRAPARATDVNISNVEGNMNVPGNQLHPRPAIKSKRKSRVGA